MLNEVIEAATPWFAGTKTLLGFDFDGTLAPLQADPETVWLSPEARSLLEKCCSRYECAFVSGRGLADLKRRVSIEQAHFVGTHGSQIALRDGTLWSWESEAWTAWLAKHGERFREFVEGNAGLLEPKGLGLTVHYRGSAREEWWEFEGRAALESELGTVATLMGGSKCWNVLPAGAPNKGDSVWRLCRTQGYERVVFFGDDLTDETVFEQKNFPVLGVKVGESKSSAQLRVKSPEEVLAVLRHFT